MIKMIADKVFFVGDKNDKVDKDDKLENMSFFFLFPFYDDLS